MAGLKASAGALWKYSAIVAGAGLLVLGPASLFLDFVNTKVMPNVAAAGVPMPQLPVDVGVILSSVAGLTIGVWAVNQMAKQKVIKKNTANSLVVGGSVLITLQMLSKIQTLGLGQALQHVMGGQYRAALSNVGMMNGTSALGRIKMLGNTHNNNNVGQNYVSQTNQSGLYSGNNYGSVSGRVFGTPRIGATSRVNLF